VSSDLEAFQRFLEVQESKQAQRFATVKAPKVLSFMGTTSRSGTHAAVAASRLLAIEPGPTPRDLRITLAGPLPRAPARGECVTVHLTRVEHYQGYQVKTRPLALGAPESDLVEPAPGGTLVKGVQIFTVHHSPYTLKFYDAVPVDEVRDVGGAVPYALVAVGETANLSPRFVFHRELQDGKPILFHGDGLALKTYMNLKANRHETRVLVDLDDYTGWVLRGAIDEFAPHQHPEAYEKICRGFASGGWGRPSRVFKFVAETMERIAPAGQARAAL
jgi:hypothetical protein